MIVASIKTRESMKKDLSSIEIDKEIKRLESNLDGKRLRFAYSLANGLSRSRSFVDAFGYWDTAQCNRVLKSGVSELVPLLKQKNVEKLTFDLNMNREERLQDHLLMMLTAKQRYMDTGEAAHLAQYWKGASIINTMTGDNAPQEVHHKGIIMQASLSEMSPTKATEVYKAIMGGAKIIEGEISH